MTDFGIDQEQIKQSLARFFHDNQHSVSTFGQTVNQTFEAFVFSAVGKWYRERGWQVTIVNPSSALDQSATVQLKFSTRGRPSKYTHIRCEKDGKVVQVRHQLRVATKYYLKKQLKPANICLDVAVIKDINLNDFKSDDFVLNRDLVTFGEAKHMSAFAELVAGFVGLVHELQPIKLKRIRSKDGTRPDDSHPPPFLYVSGFLLRTADGIVETIKRRGYDIEVYNRVAGLAKAASLPARVLSTSQSRVTRRARQSSQSRTR